MCQTLEALRDSTDVSYEVIVVNDASSDSCCDFLRSDPFRFANTLLVDLEERHGVALSRAVGAGRAGAPVLVFMDAHCFPRRGWLEKLLAEIDKPGAGIVAPQISSAGNPGATTFGLTLRDRELSVEWLPRRGGEPYHVPMAGGGCMVMTKEFYQTMGGFDAMRSFGLEDVELCIRTWLSGYTVTMVPGAEVAHCFKQKPFPVSWHDHLYNRLRTAVLHFDGAQLERILACARTRPQFAEAACALLSSDIWTRYDSVRSKRKHDAEWFCRKFGIEI